MARTAAGTRTQAGTRTNVNRTGIVNSDFENAPSFVAATTTNTRWIDGTSAGSTRNDNYRWSTNLGGTASARFDTSVSHSGSVSMKASTLAANSFAAVRQDLQNSITAIKYSIPALPSTPYTYFYWMQTTLTSGSSSTGAHGSVLEFNANGGQIASHLGSSVLTTTAWTLYTVSFTSNVLCAYLQISNGVTGNNGSATLIMDAWFDDLYLTAGTARSVA